MSKPNNKKISDAIAGVAASSPVVEPSDEAGASAAKSETSIPHSKEPGVPVASEKPKAVKPVAKLAEEAPVQNVPGKFHKFQK